MLYKVSNLFTSQYVFSFYSEFLHTPFVVVILIGVCILGTGESLD